MMMMHNSDEDDDMGHNPHCHQRRADFLPQLPEE